MAVSPAARARARADAERAVREQKRSYAERLRRLLAAATPALSNAELSLGLELDEREVGRFLSDSVRMAHARPDGELRALIDALLGGALVLAVRAGPPGARREVVVVEPAEARRLDRSWSLLLDAAVGLRQDELEDDELWGLGVRRVKRGPARRRRFLGVDRFPVALGTLLLGTGGRAGAAGRPDPEAARALLRAALDAGVEIVDTADSYALDEDDLGHVERLLADFPIPVVVTKAGLRRPGGRWLPDGSPARLRAACEASLRNLRAEALDLMLLHVVDPRVPFLESVGALAQLRAEGKLRQVGLSNVDEAQLLAALELVPVAAVQVELGRHRPQALALAARCEELGIALMAHRPLGGVGHVPDRALVEVAAGLGVSPQQLSLAWLCAAAPNLFPVVGATRPESIRDSAAAATLEIVDFARLDQGMPARVVGDAIVLVSGPPAAGKTSLVQPFLERGFQRLNRDELGGRLEDLVPRMGAAITAGQRRFVLDNTWPTRRSRRLILDAAAGIPVRCLHVDTPLGEALYNACLRWIQRYGRLPEPDEVGREANDLPPQAIFRYFQLAEAPERAEGFTSVERLPFTRRPTGTRRGLLLDVDGTLRRTRSGAPFPRSADDVEILPGRAEKLQALAAEGWLLRGVSNQSGIARGEVDRATVEALFRSLAEALGVELPVRYCPHPAGEIRCWCRKPMPGLGVAWVEAEGLDRAASLVVGDLDSDRLFAEHLGLRFAWAADFFGG